MLHDDEGAITIEERVFDDFSGEYLTATREPEMDIFSETEQKALAFVKDYFARRSASFISDLSHHETGYVQTFLGDLISYQFAASLSI